MRVAITKGINMEQPTVKKEIVVRTETSLGHSSLSLADERAGVMLFIKINKKVKELLKEITEEERPKSKWVKIDERAMCYRCTFKHERWIANFGFCPNCGAEMEGEE